MTFRAISARPYKLASLERVLYEYRCARHTGGQWDPDDALIRTVSTSETTTGVGHVTCAGRGNALLGYIVGVVIAPINFTLAASAVEAAPSTANGYWIILGSVAAGDYTRPIRR